LEEFGRTRAKAPPGDEKMFESFALQHVMCAGFELLAFARSNSENSKKFLQF